MRAASPLLLLAGQLRGTLSVRTSAGSGVTRSTRSGDSSSGRAPRASRPKSSAPRATRCAPPRRSRALDAVGRAERVGAADAARGAASRGVGRREVLRDARRDLGGSRAPHRPDGAAVSVHRARVRRQVPGDDRRAQSRLADVQQRALSARSATTAARRAPSCRSGGRASRIGAIGSYAMCHGGWSAPRRWRFSRSPSASTTHDWAALPLLCHAGACRSWARRLLEAGARRAAGRPDIKQLLAPRNRTAASSVEEDGALTRVTLLGQNLFASGNADVNAGERADRCRVASALEQVPGRVLVDRSHRRPADSVATLSRQLRSCHASARRAWRRFCRSR